MRTTISTIVPALAALAFAPLLGAAEGEEPAKDQRQEMSSLNEESIRTLDKTGRLLIVDLGEEAISGDNRIHFKQVWKDRSLEGDVPDSIRYVVICDPKGATAERKAVRDAFEDDGFYQITWFYVDDPAVIDRARQGEQGQDRAAVEGASDDRADRADRADRERNASESGADGDVSGAALREDGADSKPPGVTDHAHGATSTKTPDVGKGHGAGGDATRTNGADAKPPGVADQTRGAKGEHEGKANGAKASESATSDGADQATVSPTSPKTPDRPKAAE